MIMICSACGKDYGATGHSCGDATAVRELRILHERSLLDSRKSYLQLEQRLLEQRKYAIPLAKQLVLISSHP